MYFKIWRARKCSKFWSLEINDLFKNEAMALFLPYHRDVFKALSNIDDGSFNAKKI